MAGFKQLLDPVFLRLGSNKHYPLLFYTTCAVERIPAAVPGLLGFGVSSAADRFQAAIHRKQIRL
jgi:hypothetical protein